MEARKRCKLCESGNIPTKKGIHILVNISHEIEAERCERYVPMAHQEVPMKELLGTPKGVTIFVPEEAEGVKVYRAHTGNLDD